MAFMILRTLMFTAPETLFPEDVARKFKKGQLSPEDLLELV